MRRNFDGHFAPTISARPFSIFSFLNQSEFQSIKEADDINVLVAAINAGLPPICAVNTLALDYWDRITQHAVVVVEIGANHVLLNDPAYADDRQRVTRDAFLLAWADHDYQYAILQPR